MDAALNLSLLVRLIYAVLFYCLIRFVVPFRDYTADNSLLVCLIYAVLFYYLALYVVPFCVYTTYNSSYWNDHW